MPLISLTDIMMTVLLFFILTSGASQANNDHFINVKHKFVREKDIQYLEIEIDRTGHLKIDDKPILQTQLRDFFTKSKCQDILMKVDRNVPIIFVVEVMNVASDLGISTAITELKNKRE